MSNLKASNAKIVKILVSVIAFMLCITLASVPLYDMFCKITGFAGTTSYRHRVRNEVTEASSSKKIIVQFDSNINANLNWKFYPLQNSVEVVPGKTALVYFYAENLSNKPIIGTSIFNVTPQKAGQYFVKIQCFCFEEQLLRPGESMKMPVLFTIDPDILTNEETKEVEIITVSYTFFKVREL